MDKLEKFIKENRSQLDPYEPPARTWEQISGRTGVRRTGRMFFYSAAATVAVITGISLFFWSRHQTNPGRIEISSETRQELRETELFYNSMYHELYMKGKPLLTGKPDIAKEIDEGSARIDSICSDLKSDLRDNISNKEVIEALIRNYRIKIQLLEEMLEAVKQNETEKKVTNHEL